MPISADLSLAIKGRGIKYLPGNLRQTFFLQCQGHIMRPRILKRKVFGQSYAKPETGIIIGRTVNKCALPSFHFCQIKPASDQLYRNFLPPTVSKYSNQRQYRITIFAKRIDQITLRGRRERAQMQVANIRKITLYFISNLHTWP